MQKGTALNSYYHILCKSEKHSKSKALSWLYIVAHDLNTTSVVPGGKGYTHVACRLSVGYPVRRPAPGLVRIRASSPRICLRALERGVGVSSSSAWSGSRLSRDASGNVGEPRGGS